MAHTLPLLSFSSTTILPSLTSVLLLLFEFEIPTGGEFLAGSDKSDNDTFGNSEAFFIVTPRAATIAQVFS